jgi:hypothetical protein
MYDRAVNHIKQNRDDDETDRRANALRAGSKEGVQLSLSHWKRVVDANTEIYPMDAACIQIPNSLSLRRPLPVLGDVDQFP